MRLRYTLKAAFELDQVLTHVAEASPLGARHAMARIQAVTDLLVRQPRMGQATRNRRLRRMTVIPYPYLIFYQVTDDEVIIHGVRHGARHPSTMPS